MSVLNYITHGPASCLAVLNRFHLSWISQVFFFFPYIPTWSEDLYKTIVQSLHRQT